MSTTIEESKLSTETIRIWMDMLSRMRVGETAMTCDVTVTTHMGEDDNPTEILLGDPSVSGSRVVQQITGGIPGVIYQLSFATRTSDNNILINQCLLAVLEGPTVTPAALP